MRREGSRFDLATNHTVKRGCRGCAPNAILHFSLKTIWKERCVLEGRLRPSCVGVDLDDLEGIDKEFDEIDDSSGKDYDDDDDSNNNDNDSGNTIAYYDNKFPEPLLARLPNGERTLLIPYKQKFDGTVLFTHKDYRQVLKEAYRLYGSAARNGVYHCQKYHNRPRGPTRYQKRELPCRIADKQGIARKQKHRSYWFRHEDFI